MHHPEYQEPILVWATFASFRSASATHIYDTISRCISVRFRSSITVMFGYTSELQCEQWCTCINSAAFPGTKYLYSDIRVSSDGDMSLVKM